MKSLFILKFVFFLFSNPLYSQVHTKYFNQRFVWIEVPSKYVKARLNYPIDGFSVCWIEVKTPKESFDFVLRRGLPYENCMARVLSMRKLLSKNKTVEIIGNMGTKDKIGHYFTSWELLRGKTGCVGYFGGCEDFEKDVPEWHDWKSKPVDPKLYP